MFFLKIVPLALSSSEEGRIMKNTKLGSMPLNSREGGIKHFNNGVHMLQLWANICIIETDEGLVLYDVGFYFNRHRILEEVKAITDKPVRYIIYGHGHADHAFGAQAVIKDAEESGSPRPIIVAHENVPKRFNRYQEMLSYHNHINRIQFAIPEDKTAFVRSFIYPDVTYQDSMNFRLGDTTFELRHSKGETDDATWIWIPERKTVCISDLWIWSCPNIGNPFKVQRYETEWARGLEEVAARSPELMLPGHGDAIVGTDNIQDACLTVARALRFLHDQVVDMLNRGMWQEEILQSFEWPEEFALNPYLAAIYGHPYFIVQAILRRYHGWYDGNPSHLFPSTASEIAEEVVDTVGDVQRFIDRARRLAKEGRVQLALHIVDFVIDGSTNPETEALELKIQLLEELARNEASLIARNILLSGVRQIKKLLEEG
jgi:alkyl sulfatase BDS1-like metallo-beta-lactamase superfamily hydrolase